VGIPRSLKLSEADWADAACCVPSRMSHHFKFARLCEPSPRESNAPAPSAEGQRVTEVPASVLVPELIENEIHVVEEEIHAALQLGALTDESIKFSHLTNFGDVNVGGSAVAVSRRGADERNFPAKRGLPRLAGRVPERPLRQGGNATSDVASHCDRGDVRACGHGCGFRPGPAR
jgi:hypothetical protein